MTDDLVHQFLGVSGSSDPRVILGVRLDETHAAAIEVALRQRIGETYRHPEGRSENAERVRGLLRELADGLLRSQRAVRVALPSAHRRPRDPARSLARLTDFDRNVLGVLIGCGGWNAEARSRLVALATANGVSVQGLIKVVSGLSEYAKSGGARLGVAEIVGGGSRLAALPHAPQRRADPELQWLVRVAPELRESSASSKFKLSLLFGSITLLLAVIAVRMLFSPSSPEPASNMGVGRPTSIGPPAVSPPSGVPGAPAGAGAVEPPRQRVARFTENPTFMGHARTIEVVRAADECPQLVAEIDTLARRITIADEPSQAVYRSWEECVRIIGTGWVLIDDSVQAELEQAIFEVLYAASASPSVADRLLGALAPPTGRLSAPVDVWRGAWMAGMLARIGHSRSLSPAVVERARILLDLALGDPDPDRVEDFNAAAFAWLEWTAERLVDITEFNPAVYDLWEFWIAAERRLGRGQRFDEAVITAMEYVLVSPNDLAREGPSVNVLGRLVEMADFDSSRIVKERFESFLAADEQRIGTRDLWVLTSLLARSDGAAWFSEDLVLPEDADWMFRRRIADRIVDRWPEAASVVTAPVARVRGIPVDPQLAARWLDVFAREQGPPPGPTQEQLLAQLDAACRLNEAAARLASGDAESARELLDWLSGEGADPSAPGRQARQRPGEPIGSDGLWAARFEEARNRAEEKTEVLHALRFDAGTDLGPIDAAVFVRAVYHGAPREVRELAQSIVVDQFATGPQVAQELVDRLSGVAPSEEVATVIEQVSGRFLPPVRSESWRADARLALVEHALDLLRVKTMGIDRSMEAVQRVYVNRRSALQPQWTPSSADVSPYEAARGLAEAWEARAVSGGPAASAVPAELPDLQRRQAARMRLAEGPLQQFVAAQIGVLELMAFVAVQEQPGLSDAVVLELADSARRRLEATNVLEQAVEGELAMGRLWRLQMVVDDSGDES